MGLRVLRRLFYAGWLTETVPLAWHRGRITLEADYEAIEIGLGPIRINIGILKQVNRYKP